MFTKGEFEHNLVDTVSIIILEVDGSIFSFKMVGLLKKNIDKIQTRVIKDNHVSL